MSLWATAQSVLAYAGPSLRAIVYIIAWSAASRLT